MTLAEVIREAAEECYRLDKAWRHGAEQRAPDMYGSYIHDSL